MTPEEKSKLFDLRCKSKNGIVPNKKESKFLSDMFTKYPDEYAAMNEDVFYATRPFGSDREYPK